MTSRFTPLTPSNDTRHEIEGRGNADIVEQYEQKFDRMADQEDRDARKRGRDFVPHDNDAAHSERRLENGSASLGPEVEVESGGSPTGFENLSMGNAQKEAARAKTAARKSAQLCAQVGDIVSTEISREGDMLGYVVQEVSPQPGSSVLTVIIQQIQRETHLTTSHASAWLIAHSTAIRAAVSSGISRSRTPSLHYVVLPYSAVRVPDGVIE